MKHIYLVFFLFLLANLGAQNRADFNGIRSLGLGGTGLTDLHAASLWQNPASLSGLNGWQFSTEYIRPIYTVAIGLSSASVIKGDGRSGIGIGFSRWGTSNMADQILSAAYAIKLNKSISLGVRLDLNQLFAFSGSASSHYFTAGIGFNYRINDKFQLAAFVFNPNRSPIQMEETSYRSASNWELGFKHRISENIHWFLEAAQEQGFSEIDWQSGLEYALVEDFHLHFGYRSNASAYSFGFSLAKQNWKTSFASTWHPELGFGGGIGLEYALD